MIGELETFLKIPNVRGSRDLYERHVKFLEQANLLNIFFGPGASFRLEHDGWTRLGRTPPSNAAFLFYLFLDTQNCDAIVGDLEERYKLICKEFGARKANFWYWTQAIRSVGPIVWAWGKRAALKPVIGVIAWTVARGLVGHDSWLAELVEMWKRIRS